jgi:hypothetical protein
VKSGKEVSQFEGQEGGVNNVAFSPDGTTIASAGGGFNEKGDEVGKTIRLWDLRTQKLVKEIQGHETPVMSVAFSPDGRRLVSCAGYSRVDEEPLDCTVRLWDVASGKELYCFKGHKAEVISVAISPDGKHAVSGSVDSSIRLWRLPGPGAGAQKEPKDEKPDNQGIVNPWEVVQLGGASIAIPREWRDVPVKENRTLLYRQGDGIGVPAMDETQAPLQIGMTVEKFARTKESLKEGIDGLVRAAKKNRHLKQVGKESIDSLKLSDDSDAMLLVMEFIKDQDRRSLQMKMVVKDNDANVWVVSGFVVGGKDSKIPNSESDIAKWLRGHVTSFCLNGKKLDEKKLTEANKGQDGKQ